MSSLKLPSKVYPFENLSNPCPSFRSSLKLPELWSRYPHSRPNIHQCHRNRWSQSFLTTVEETHCRACHSPGTCRPPKHLHRPRGLTGSRVSPVPPSYSHATPHRNCHRPDRRTFPCRDAVRSACTPRIDSPSWNAPPRRSAAAIAHSGLRRSQAYASIWDLVWEEYWKGWGGLRRDPPSARLQAAWWLRSWLIGWGERIAPTMSLVGMVFDLKWWD